MLELTRVRVDGPGELVVDGETLIVRGVGTQNFGRSQSCGECGTDDSVLRELASDLGAGLLSLCRVGFRVGVGLVVVLCRHIAFPVIRELVCVAGTAALSATGVFLRYGATQLLRGSAELRSHSRLLRARSTVANDRGANLGLARVGE